MRNSAAVLRGTLPCHMPSAGGLIGRGNIAGAFGFVKEFRRANAAVWVGTLFLAGGMALWYPQILLKKGYGIDRAMAAVALWSGALVREVLMTANIFALTRRWRLHHG